MMENEKRGLMHKKVLKDQFMAFVKLKFGALSLFSLSHSLGNLRVFLEHFSLEQRKKNVREGKEKKARNKERKEGSNSFSRNTCR